MQHSDNTRQHKSFQQTQEPSIRDKWFQEESSIDTQATCVDLLPSEVTSEEGQRRQEEERESSCHWKQGHDGKEVD